ncbi:hypothetical protein CGCTS75_v005293 [Colletotrichum tropicale]|nr:hypothetical protein CGCTS75_v005293 [Colletotrichum tropicale]
MAVLFSAFSFFQDSFSIRPQRGPAQPTEKKSLSPSLTRHHNAGCRLRLGCRYQRNLPRWATFSDSRPPQYCAAYPDHVHTRVIRSMMRHRQSLQTTMPRYIQIENIAAESHVLLPGVTRAKQEMCSAK